MDARMVVMLEPERHGYEECPDCRGVPSFETRCPTCDGWGLIKMRAKTGREQRQEAEA